MQTTSTTVALSSYALKRKANTERRNAKIRATFDKDFTEQARPRRYTREFIIARIAADVCLSMATVEDIIYKTPSANKLAAAA